MWFTYVDSPLGSNIRIKKKFVIAHSHTESELKIMYNKVSNFLNLRVIQVLRSDIDAIYDIVAVDPDAADLIREGVNHFIIAEIA